LDGRRGGEKKRKKKGGDKRKKGKKGGKLVSAAYTHLLNLHCPMAPPIIHDGVQTCSAPAAKTGGIDLGLECGRRRKGKGGGEGGKNAHHLLVGVWGALPTTSCMYSMSSRNWGVTTERGEREGREEEEGGKK